MSDAVFSSTALSTGCEPTWCRVSSARPRPSTSRACKTFSQVRGELGDDVSRVTGPPDRPMKAAGGTSVTLNVTPAMAPEQDVIHRHPRGVVGSASRGFDPVESQRVPLAGHSVSTGAACPRESTMSVGGRCQPNWHCRSAGVAAPDPPWRDTREQAYVPAEQPSPSQGARLPSPDAHPCGSQHPCLASPQGPQEPGRLRPGLLQASPPCCPRLIGCGTPTPFVPRFAGDGERGREPWSSISPPRTVTTPVATLLGWGSWSARPWATPPSATV